MRPPHRRTVPPGHRRIAQLGLPVEVVRSVPAIVTRARPADKRPERTERNRLRALADRRRPGVP
ncbi:hypothetical protein ACF09L_01465 [Streptomyces sp. NPDC014779]|uniref:hypothetical protein n=1 Tax=Streptomyces sp. NPDC014779 TaxID=3364911 RepID=UPI0036F6E70D